MSEIEIVTRHSGQEVLVFRCDQQLYRVVLGVIGPVQKEGKASIQESVECTG